MTKKRTLGFPGVDLLLVRDGIKDHTLRFDQRMKDAQPGEVLQMRFGARNAPQVLHAPITRVERVDFNALIAAEEDTVNSPWLDARYDWFMENDQRRLLKHLKFKDCPDYDTLIRLCDELQLQPFDLWTEAEDSGRPIMTVIWWKLDDADRRTIPQEDQI